MPAAYNIIAIKDLIKDFTLNEISRLVIDKTKKRDDEANIISVEVK